jgi:hypothetical protein
MFDQKYYLIDKIFEVKEELKKKLIFMLVLVALRVHNGINLWVKPILVVLS